MGLFFAQASEKQNTCIRMKNVIFLVNDKKISIKKEAFIDMLHSNICGAKCNHGPYCTHMWKINIYTKH